MGYQVFVSYSEPDRELVDAIREATRSLDITVYSYDQDPQPGESLREKLLYQIEESDVVLVILTHASVSSAAVNHEIGIAIKDGKLVIPVVEKGVRTDRFSFLDGVEPVILDRKNPLQTLARITNRLANLKKKSDRVEIVSVALLAGIAWWLTRPARDVLRLIG
ncbi:MAG TPA: toll/interleukin-1 receptor domain-containing protein [Longimicrobium sp.]|nr:toll/interleukin-1 receptor domain-containing protein [Longimicrobium sp.]